MNRITTKGQATLFMIIGILILLFVSLTIYYRQVVLQEPEILDPEVAPVKNYVTDCLQQLGADAVRLAGDQGGYVTLPSEIEAEQAFVSLTPRGLFKRPYWYFKGKSYIPSVELMQEQISAYVTENIDTCLDSFVAFESQFEITPREDIAVDTTITEEDVVIDATQLIRIKNRAKDEVTYIKQFTVVLPVRLKQAYDLGRRIVQEENRNLFLENITLDLMALHPDIPFTGLTFSCSRQRWRLDTIERAIQDMAHLHFPRLRIENTAHAPFLADDSDYEAVAEYDVEDIAAGDRPTEKPADAYEYFHYLIDVKAKPTDLRAGFRYTPEQGIDLVARPSNGNILESSTGKSPSDYLRFLCINFHHFTYDVAFPVEVMVRDDAAFATDGFVFRFMLPVTIKSNRGNKVDFGLDVFEDVRALSVSEECDQLAGPVYDIRVRGFEDDVETELNEVTISYDCIQAACALGHTTRDGGIYRLRTQLPQFCGGGYLVAQKEGYLEARQQVLDATDIDIDLKKIVAFNVSVQKHVVSGTAVREAEDIPRNHEVLISLHSTEPPLTSYIEYPSPDPVSVQIIEDDASYVVDILYIDTLDNVIVGGYKAAWTVAVADLFDSNEVVFHVAEYTPRPINQSDVYEMLRFLEEDEAYKEALQPEFR